MRLSGLLVICVVVLAAGLPCPGFAASILRVKAGAAGANNGASWANAFVDLQAALAAAKSGDEIWVAAGIYKPTYGTDRAKSFVLVAGAGLYGGFAGTESETTREQRDWKTHETILSGDIGEPGDPPSIDEYRSDNSYHVVTGADNAVLDGFTIKEGRCNKGAGMINLAVSPTISNCAFIDNAAYSGDYTIGGGGMYNYQSSPAVTNCTFSANTADYHGGGMFSDQGSPTVMHCAFSNNVTTESGGGMYNKKSSPKVTNCTFTGNLLVGKGECVGGGMCNVGGVPQVTSCTFSGNIASSVSNGGGMYNEESPPIVTNCTFSGNSAGGGGGMCNYFGSNPTVTNCIFSENSGGGMYDYQSSPTVTHCIFNAAPSGGGLSDSDGSPQVANCAFIGNSGGGIRFGFSRWPKVTNCVFSGNSVGSGGQGGGMYIYETQVTVTNCTFSGNSVGSGGQGGGIYIEAWATITNCIIWNNSAPTGPNIYRQYFATYYNCDVQGCRGSGVYWNPALGTDGGGNIDADPKFTNPADPAGSDGIGGTADDGLRLTASSTLCINAGKSTGAPTTDMLGYHRLGSPDLGAYEYNAPASIIRYLLGLDNDPIGLDRNGDKTVDSADLVKSLKAPH